MREIPDDIMKFAKQIADTMDDCVKDFDWDGIQLVVAKAILYERNSLTAERDRLREENERLRVAVKAAYRLAYVVRKSVNAGPVSNDPTAEGQAWRALRLALGESYDEKGELLP